MKTIARRICLCVACLMAWVCTVTAADTNVLKLVEPIALSKAVPATEDAKGGQACEDGRTLQENGFCCPSGTSNKVWEEVCTKRGIKKTQIFREFGSVQYCPDEDMYIVGDKNNKWVSCAASDSTVLYPLPKKAKANEFCLQHGYGYLMSIKTRVDTGCIKFAESQGDGCIEAGTCSFKGR